MNNIYLKAAKESFKEPWRFSCCIINNVVHDTRRSWAQEAVDYEALFRPPGISGVFWLTEARAKGLIKKEELGEWRVMALLFMHQIASEEPL